MFVNFGKIFFSSSSGWLLLKNDKQTSTSFKEKSIKAGRFSSRDEVFVWKILSRLCQDPNLKKQDTGWPVFV